MEAPIPILRSFSEAEARAFYIDYLGFEVGFEHRFDPEAPLYMAVTRDACVLHLSEHHGDAAPGTTLRIRVPDVAALHGELTSRGHSRLRPGLESQPWGMIEMRLSDPFGNRLILCQDV